MTTDLKFTYDLLSSVGWKTWAQAPSALQASFEVDHFKTELYSGEVEFEALFVIHENGIGIFDVTGISFYKVEKLTTLFKVEDVCLFSYDSISRA